MTKLYITVATALISLVLSLPAAAQFGEDEAEGADEPSVETSFDSGSTSGWMFGVAPRVGLDIPTSKLGPFVVAALEFDVFLPVLDNRLVLALDFSFTYPREEGSGIDERTGGDYDWETKVLELKWALDAIWRFFEQDRTLIPFAGVGFALQYLRTAQTTSIPDTGENTESNAKPGFEILGGLDWKLGIGYLFGDVRFVFSKLDHHFTGETNAGNVTICVGYRFVF
jgi:hypothetical protein